MNMPALKALSMPLFLQRMNIFFKKTQHPVCGFAFSAIFVEQASNKSQLGRRYSNPNLVHRNAWLDNSRYYIFVRCNGAYQTNPIHQANVAYKYSWYVYVFLVALYPCVHRFSRRNFIVYGYIACVL